MSVPSSPTFHYRRDILQPVRAGVSVGMPQGRIGFVWTRTAAALASQYTCFAAAVTREEFKNGYE